MRGLTIFFISAVLAGAAGPDLNALIAQAKAAPGEFSADALLRLAALESLPKDRRLELAAGAFEKASAAQHPYSRRAAVLRNDGAASLFDRVYSQDLDSLSLRLRAVEAMLPLDVGKAATWFARIPEIRLPRTTCEDFQVIDPHRFYTVLGKLSAALSGSPERMNLLRPYPTAITSPVQVAGMASVISAAEVDDAGFQMLLRDFISAMAAIKGDDRSFTWSQGVARQIGVLRDAVRRRGISPLPLLESYRVYVVFNLSGTRCADSDIMKGGHMEAFELHTPDDSDPQAVELASHFNRKLLMSPLQPIQPMEVMPSRVSGAASGLRACEDEQCLLFLERYRELLTIPRDSPEWAEKLEASAAGLGQWTSSAHAGGVQFFLEKSSAYSTLLNLAASGPARATVTRGLIGFLEKSPVQELDRAAWLLAVNALTGRATLDPLGFKVHAEDLRKFGNPVIALYAALEEAAPRTPDRILPLL